MMKKRSLKFKLILGGILAAILPLAVVGFFAISKSSDALVKAAKSQSLQIAKNLAVMTDTLMQEEVKIAKGISLEPMVLDTLSKVLEQGLENSGEQIKSLDNFFVKIFGEIGKDYDLFFIADQNGNTLSDSTGGTLREKNISIKERDYFISAKDGKISIGKPVLSKASGKPVVVIAVPIQNASGQFAGIFGSVLKLDGVSEKITAVKLGETGYPFMIGGDGIIIAHPNKEYKVYARTTVWG